MRNEVETHYNTWLKKAVKDEEIRKELLEIANTPSLMEDAFYKNLSFGTGGLRGIIGAGINRMNVYTVAKASQGLADYVQKNYSSNNRKIAVSYDSRINSQLFAKTASEVFAANNIQVYIFEELMPTPCLSFATRELQCAAGIMITASHNPAKYNGYKVYGADGCQITTETAKEILCNIEKIDIFTDVLRQPFEQALQESKINYISQEIVTNFIEEVKKQSMLNEHDVVDKDVKIVYSPLNGAGLKPVLRVLRESGYTDITVVSEQEKPDGYFPTCRYPNPENRETMQLGMNYAERFEADLCLATDPDCDRVGVAVKGAEGDYILLSGNETGILLLDYICAQRMKMGKMPKNPVIVKTIVTTDMAEKVANQYGASVVNVLTGFKFIGEQIGLLENQDKKDSYIFGFEESYGYLSGTYVRDKDAVNAVLLICEMFAYYSNKGVSLYERMETLYKKHGYWLNTLYSFEFEGIKGNEQMKKIMHRFRESTTHVFGKKIKLCHDYAMGIDGLPKSDVVKFILNDNCSIVIRPSGTEPKLKVYISMSAETKEIAEEKEQSLKKSLESYLEELIFDESSGV